MARALFFLALSAVACRAPSSAPAPSPSAGGTIAPTPSGAAPLPVSSAVAEDPPVPAKACTRDDECAVASVEVSGKRPCCGACGTTPGTRRWHADLQRWCAAHPPTDCPPLACPQGPTRAVCRAGLCEATATGPDGGFAFVTTERRCLPSLVCDTWSGCTQARGNDQDGWFVESSERAPRGALVALTRVALIDKSAAEAFLLHDPNVKCLPHTEPPVLPAPPVCVEAGGQCKQK